MLVSKYLKRNFTTDPQVNFFLYLDFFSRTFMSHRTAGEEKGHFFDFSLPLPSASKALTH